MATKQLVYLVLLAGSATAANGRDVQTSRTERATVAVTVLSSVTVKMVRQKKDSKLVLLLPDYPPIPAKRVVRDCSRDTGTPHAICEVITFDLP
jgi:hypothetical protein